MDLLMPHNAKTLGEVETYMQRGESCCVVNPCGSGKTSIMAAFMKNHEDKSVLVITKQRNAAEYYKSRDPIFARECVKIVTFTKLLIDVKNGNLEGYDKDVYLVDEAHYVGANQWSIAFTLLTQRFSPVVIGLTATPQRLTDQGTGKDVIKDYFDGNSAGNFTTQQLEEQNVFVKPEYILSIFDLESLIEEKRDALIDSEISDEIKFYHFDELDKALKTWKENSTPELIFKNYLPHYMYKDHCNRILVYVANAADLQEKRTRIDDIIRSVFPSHNIRSYSYTYKDSEAVLRDYLKEDESVDIKIMYAIDKIMETVHIDDLRIVIMLRPSVSGRIIVQQFGRINSIANKHQPIIIDMVDNLSKLNMPLKDADQSKAPKARRTYSPREADENSRSVKRARFYSQKIPNVEYYADIFKSVDNALALGKKKYYRHEGFVGTLKEFCYVYGLQYESAMEIMEEKQNIEEVISLAKPVKRKISQKIFDGATYLPEDGLTLSHEQRQFAEENEPWINAFIIRRKIADEDFKQEVLLRYLSAVVETDGVTPRYKRKMKIQSTVHNFYLSHFRNKVARTKLYEDFYSDAVINSCEDILCEGTIKDVMNGQLREALEHALSSLAPRENAVLRSRFGLDSGQTKPLEDVGKEFGVSKERIRQIEAKALRRLRHPSRSRPLREYMENIN